MDALTLGRQVFDKEITAMRMMRDALDQVFAEVVERIVSCQGKVILTGMGKPGHVCQKLAATFSSLGTPSFFLHPAEAQHGDLGMISPNDIVIMISYSGESEEVIHLLQNIRLIGAPIIGITANATSTLARNCDLLQLLPPFEEACYMKLAPTSSTTVELAYGDALAVASADQRGFDERAFSLFHPAGALGKKLLLTVRDVMASGSRYGAVSLSAHLHDAIVEMSAKQMEVVCIEDENHRLCGIITDGDLRRALGRKADIYSMAARDIMTEHPHTILDTAMAVDALVLMKKKNVSCLPVLTEDGTVAGVTTMTAIVNAGLVG